MFISIFPISSYPGLSKAFYSLCGEGKRSYKPRHLYRRRPIATKPRRFRRAWARSRRDGILTWNKSSIYRTATDMPVHQCLLCGRKTMVAFTSAISIVYVATNHHWFPFVQPHVCLVFYLDGVLDVCEVTAFVHNAAKTKWVSDLLKDVQFKRRRGE